MKLYILILDDVPLGHAINAAAHGSLMSYKAWEGIPEYDEWYHESFKKVTCKVNQKELDKAMSVPEQVHCRIITESSLDNRIVGAVFCPISKDKEYPNCFKYFRLYK